MLFKGNISAKNNWLTTFDVVNSLQSLEQLHSISLQGNPINLQLSHYRARVILRLQSISYVDGVKVTADEKVKARVCVGEETDLRRAVHTEFLPLDLFYDTVPPFNETGFATTLRTSLAFVAALAAGIVFLNTISFDPVPDR